MATYMYMKCDTIRGDCQDADHAGWIEIDGFDFVFEHERLMEASRHGNAQASDVTIHKRIDLASCLLLTYCTRGTEIESLVIESCRAGETENDQAIPSTKITLTTCRIKSMEIKPGSASDPLPTEQITIGFDTILWEHKDTTISKTKAAPSAKFDFSMPEAI